MASDSFSPVLPGLDVEYTEPERCVIHRFDVIGSARLLSSAIYAIMTEIFPDSTGSIHWGVVPGMTALRSQQTDFAVVDADTVDLDGLDYIPRIFSESLARWVLIVSHRRDERALQVLRKLRYDAWIDANAASLQELRFAFRELESGRRYTSPSIVAAWLSLPRPFTNSMLTCHEELLLSMLGSGIDNEEAADRLGISSETIRTHRCRVMRKLNLHHKGELIQFAVSHGYVRIAHSGILHPGFQSALRSQLQKPHPVRKFA